MKSADLVIVGAGMVGLALAGQLAACDCRIILVEQAPPQFNLEQTSNRVSAINFASQSLLEEIGAWQHIPAQKRSPYDQMEVWEKDSFAQIQFDNQDPALRALGLDQLGFIIENQQIQHALYEQVKTQANVEFVFDKLQKLGISENGAFLTFEDGQMLSAKLVVGADGAQSWVRNQSHIPLISRDYEHTALVCNVKTAEPHEQTARQIFAPDSILAFLPMKDPHQCSIVWSLPPERAAALQACEEADFNKQLTIAFDNRLGLCHLQGSRNIYPLVARYARDFAQPRLALIGDAAHTIHPLAGLGVNLGFADAKCLAQELALHLAAGHDIGDYRHLRRFERKRKVEAVKLLGSMGVLKELFADDHPVKKLVRGLGLSLTNQLRPVKNQLLKQALGLPTHL
ncbi:FAD-dependent 2-octaprenylphenol hydroxylase [Pasteurellaceae bacterium RH1A]|nr:FAD-dependent 2-octaprenylphenol hydroxylase [Pasteurellaceae bacterium RH1A]